MEKSKVKKSRKNGCFFKTAWIVFICLTSVLLSKFIMMGINDMLAVGKSPDTLQIEILENSSIDEVAQILKDKNIITERWFFKLYALATKSPKVFSAGIYELEGNMDYQSIINHIKNRDNIRDIVEVTITEGMNILECAALMEKNEICDKDEFLKYCSSGRFDEKYNFIKEIESHSPRTYRLEGYLFPDTYKFYRGEDPVNVINKLLSNFQKRIYQQTSIEGRSSESSICQLAENQGLSIDELINLASLIQAEAASKEDMHKVSSVISNRLDTVKTGGKNRFGEFSMNLLRIDATIYYPYKTEASIPADIRKGFSSSYNTYKIQGLPPGPICNPGFDAILAALFPTQTDFYYYCHSKTGESFFARTNEVHISNLKKAGLT